MLFSSIGVAVFLLNVMPCACHVGFVICSPHVTCVDAFNHFLLGPSSIHMSDTKGKVSSYGVTFLCRDKS